jgi:hypothetical protein
VSGFTPSSRGLLSKYDLGWFPGDALFERIARALCDAECLPRKELYESWEMARRIRRRLRGGRILDVAGGHGLLAHLMLLLDDSSANASSSTPPFLHRVPRCMPHWCYIFRGGMTLVIAATAFATWHPARRAARVVASQALRADA